MPQTTVELPVSPDQSRAKLAACRSVRQAIQTGDRVLEQTVDLGVVPAVGALVGGNEATLIVAAEELGEALRLGIEDVVDVGDRHLSKCIQISVIAKASPTHSNVACQHVSG